MNNISPLGSYSDTKRCSKCDLDKPLKEFSKRSDRKDKPQSACKQCVAAVSLKRYYENSEKLKQYQKEYYKEHSVERNEYQQRYRTENSEKVAEYNREYNFKRRTTNKEYRKYDLEYSAVSRSYKAAWEKLNKEKRQNQRNEWIKKNREKLRAKWRNRDARKRQGSGKHTDADIKELLLLQRGKCPVCKKSILKSYHVDHVIPLVHGGSNDRINIQLLCPQCNLRKGAKDPIEFMQSNGFIL